MNRFIGMTLGMVVIGGGSIPGGNDGLGAGRKRCLIPLKLTLSKAEEG